MRSKSMKTLMILALGVCVSASASAETNGESEARALYLGLMKRSLLDDQVYWQKTR
jgi:hypothetical protein